MKYGITRKLDVCSLETGKGVQVVATGGDYLQTKMWQRKNLKNFDEQDANTMADYAWAHFTLERLGMLDRFGLSENLSIDEIFSMSQKVSICFLPIKDDELPLLIDGQGM